MFVQRRLSNYLEGELRPPWSPLGVAGITLLLPPGGAILTVLNLRRLNELDAALTRQLIAAVIAVFALGSATLLVLTMPRPGTVGAADSSASSILSVGIALASYLAQRSSFLRWRVSHTRARTSSLLSAVGVALVSTLVWIVIAVPLYALIIGLQYLAGLWTAP